MVGDYFELLQMLDDRTQSLPPIKDVGGLSSANSDQLCQIISHASEPLQLQIAKHVSFRPDDEAFFRLVESQYRSVQYALASKNIFGTAR
jgi:hypothetical protein